MRKIRICFCMLLTLIMGLEGIGFPYISVEAAVTKGKIKVQFSIPKKKIRLNKKKITLTKGSSFQLKLIGGKAKKVKWSVQNKKIATVKNGRIKAKKKGKTRIVATYRKKKYVCKLTVTEEPVQTEEPQEEGEYMMKMKIDDVEVSVAWEDNESVRELKKIAGNGEIKISMSMYGGFEQVGSLGTNISRQDVQMRTEPGDIVLYSGNQMVVFYGSNTWAYTRLGKIQGLTSEELKNLLGTGNVTITIFAHS